MRVTKEKIHLLRKNIQQFGWFIPLSNLLILYGIRFLPKSIARKIVNKKHQKVEDYLIKELNSTIESAQAKHFDMEYVENAPIWFCWLQGEENLPLIPSLCLKNLKKYSNGHPIHIITLDNYTDYVTIPEHIVQLYESGKIKSAHFADILRLALLHKHGGLWADATVFLSDTLSDEIFNLPFYSIKTKEHGGYVSRCRWSVFFLAGWKGNPIFGVALEMFYVYLKNNTNFVDYLMMDYFIDILYKKHKSIKGMIDKVPYNNAEIYSLRDFLCKEFDAANWAKITKRTQIFKLDWRMYRNGELEKNRNNYFVHLSETSN
ncbi:capsular polysaccharide synthesis protein [Bacteroidales bacterium OttesenSCG-928-A17]|nr:capsular polysaccharide synthesis protein [Bacteroidales bacterium OttesenSCG-928-A17]